MATLMTFSFKNKYDNNNNSKNKSTLYWTIDLFYG